MLNRQRNGEAHALLPPSQGIIAPAIQHTTNSAGLPCAQ